eukprot:15335794-Ditylum_brightwellii.AAC.1
MAFYPDASCTCTKIIATCFVLPACLDKHIKSHGKQKELRISQRNKLEEKQMTSQEKEHPLTNWSAIYQALFPKQVENNGRANCWSNDIC